MQYRFYIVDVFSETVFAGNQLAVVPDAAGISDWGLQKIAREFNFAETAFVFPPETVEGTRRVRIFTPSEEVDFAGHPTIGAACALAMHGDLEEAQWQMTLEENIGPVAVSVAKGQGDRFQATAQLSGYLDFSLYDFGPEVPAKLLGLKPAQVRSFFDASVGLPFLFVQLDCAESVDSARVDDLVFADIMAGSPTKGVFFYAGEHRPGGAFYARMCARILGIEEDPATGSACAALAGALAVQSDIRNGAFQISVVQGQSLGRRSEISAEAHMLEGNLSAIHLSGAVSGFAVGQMNLDRRFLS